VSEIKARQLALATTWPGAHKSITLAADEYPRVRCQAEVSAAERDEKDANCDVVAAGISEAGVRAHRRLRGQSGGRDAR